MIARITGRVVALGEDHVLIQAGALTYQVLTPPVALRQMVPGEEVTLETACFLQLDQSRATPVLVGFATVLQREFWETLTGVLGPTVARKAFSAPSEMIARWIETGDVTALKSLPGVGQAKARESIARLQGKLGRFVSGGIPAQGAAASAPGSPSVATGPAGEAILALLDLGYAASEASDLVNRALQGTTDLGTTEAILQEVFRRR